MGQYFVIVNLDKKEYLDPHKMGSGMKLYEITGSNLSRVLPYLLRQSTGLGGGDIYEPDRCKNAGIWAGDRIIVIGDYDEDGISDLMVKLDRASVTSYILTRAQS